MFFANCQILIVEVISNVCDCFFEVICSNLNSYSYQTGRKKMQLCCIISVHEQYLNSELVDR
jgi:hypothetical protein